MARLSRQMLLETPRRATMDVRESHSAAARRKFGDEREFFDS
jgi:hypothetical protein